VSRASEVVAFLYAAAHQIDLADAQKAVGSNPHTFLMYQRIADAAEDFIEAHRSEVCLTTPEHQAVIKAAVNMAVTRYKERVRCLERGIINLTLLMADAGVDASEQAAKCMEQLGELS
jgi:hypothetical protein